MADIKISERKHPLYSDNLDIWELYYDSAKGGDTFINDDNLFKHLLEDGDDFDKRLERAYYLNFCDTLPQIFNAYIMRETIERPPDEILKNFRMNTNGKGLSITELVKRAGYFSSIFGVIHAFVGIPFKSDKPITKFTEKAEKISPIVDLIKPIDLIDWSKDSNGNLNWVVYKYTYYQDEDITKERETKNLYKVVTTEKWWVEDEEGNPATLGKGEENKGDNSLGYIPLVTLYHHTTEDNMIGESLLKDIVYINRIILNWCSCVDEQIERQTFSQLVVPDDGSLAEKSESGDDPLHQIGTSSIWTFPGDASHPPQFISPNVENLQTIWTLVIDHIKEIYRLARLIGSSEDTYNTSRSGRSSQFGFMSVNAALSEKAKSYQEFENNINKIIYDLTGTDRTKMVPVKYPDSFDIASLQDELDTNIKIMERNFSTILNKNLQKKISRKALPIGTEDIMSEIEKEIDSGNGIVEPIKGGFGQETTGDNTGINDVGNSNDNRQRETFITNNQSKALDKKKKGKKEVIDNN